MNKETFFKYLTDTYTWVNQETFNKIDIYTYTLREYNKKYNLTRLDSEQKIYSDYYLGSIINFSNLEILKNKVTLKILDIGSGSGIPGILLKIIFPWIDLTIIESNNKKCNFMKLLANKLDLKINVVSERAEIYFHSNKKNNIFDIVTSRAVAPINKILELSVPFLKINGFVFLLKSKGYELELKESKNAINELNVKLINVFENEYNEKVYIGLTFRKERPTNKIYPRDWRLISNKPL